LRLTPAGDETEEAGVSRRGALKSIIWAGTGVLWTLSGGVPKLGDGLLGDALAAETPAFTFLQISDSHIGLRQERP
jgi:3',5'-cyclic-AMP phosphodiesterase